MPGKATIHMYNKPSFLQSSAAGRFAAAYPPPYPQQAIGQKEPVTAWARWEMTSIADELTPAPCAAAEDLGTLLEPSEPVFLADVAELRLQAQQAGEAEGYSQGYTQGQANGYAAAVSAIHDQAEHLRALTLALPLALRVADREIAGNLLALALGIARQVLGQTLALDPQAILVVVHELLQTEPALTGSPQLVLHPDDAALVQEHLTDDLQTAGWRIVVDADSKRGGCRVLAASGEWDATLETRWERVAATLTRNVATSAAVVHG